MRKLEELPFKSVETVALGDLESTASGSFYLETNRDRPYSRSGKSTSGIGLQKVLTFLKP